MYRKDFIDTEIEKLTQAIARIIGLKKEGNIEEAHEQISMALVEQLDLKGVNFDGIAVKDFEQIVKEKQYSEKQLDALAQMLFESAHPSREEDSGIINRLHLVLEVYNLLETEFHVQRLENISRRDLIDNFLNNNQYE